MVDVHRAGLDDVLGIAAVHISSWEGAYRGIVPDAWFENRTVERSAAMWQSIVPDTEPAAVWVARADDAVIGFCGLALPGRDPDTGPHTAEVTTLYVEPARWRTGAGRALMNELLAFLAEGDWLEVTLWVLEDNPRARSFYEACGFIGDGSRQSAGAGDPDEVRMRRSI